VAAFSKVLLFPIRMGFDGGANPLFGSTKDSSKSHRHLPATEVVSRRDVNKVLGNRYSSILLHCFLRHIPVLYRDPQDFGIELLQ